MSITETVAPERSWLRLAPRLAVGLAAAAVTALIIGIPTDLIDTDWFTRMTPILWWNYPAWLTSAALTGAIAATYVNADASVARHENKTLMSTFLSVFAVGCPICNKLVVLVLGMTGALTYFAPLQPYLAAASIMLLVYALRSRIKGIRACAMPRN